MTDHPDCSGGLVLTSANPNNSCPYIVTSQFCPANGIACPYGQAAGYTVQSNQPISNNYHMYFTANTNVGTVTSNLVIVWVDSPSVTAVYSQGLGSDCNNSQGQPVGFDIETYYQVQDLLGTVIPPIDTHETLENDIYDPLGSPLGSNWLPYVNIGTQADWLANNVNQNSSITWVYPQNSTPRFPDHYQFCVAGDSSLEVPLATGDANCDYLHPTSPGYCYNAFNPPYNTISLQETVYTLTQKFWVGGYAGANDFTEVCVRGQTVTYYENGAQFTLYASPIAPTYCASGYFFNSNQ